MTKSKFLNRNNLIFAILLLLILLLGTKVWNLNTKILQQTKNETSKTEKTPITTSSPDLIEVPQRNKEEKYDILKKLSTDVQISYFSKLLGNPVFVNLVGEKQDIKEYVYVDEDFYAQAVTDINDKVLSYAITSRDKDFNPTFEMSNLFKVSLNKTTFSEWRIEPSNELPLSCYYFIGAHDPIYYFEEDYFGNPGNYLKFLVGINNSAPFSDLLNTNGTYDRMTLGRIDCEKIKKTDREKLAPNTFIVRNTLLVDIKDEDLSENGPGVWFGPDNIQTRTLNE